MHSVQIPEDLEKRLEAVMRQTHRSENSYVQQALERLLEDEEDYLLAMKSLENKGPTTSLEDLVQELGLSLND